MFFIKIITLFLGLTHFVFLDAAQPWQFGFQDPATPYMESVVYFHNQLLILLVVILTFVFWLLGRSIYFFRKSVNPEPKLFVHATLLEIIWTIIPFFILMVIAIPSFAILYASEEIIDPALTLKVTGKQWYWCYEYSDYTTLEGGESLNFESYMIPEDELTPGNLRLLEVDNRVVLPINTHIRFLVTSSDVLHCWAMPSFALKVDACPGRLNIVGTFIQREGTYYGQCSEICGINHGFMPIVIKAVPVEDFVDWVVNKLSLELDGS